ncbi:unnamed protein product [Agarophyton chilense]
MASATLSALPADALRRIAQQLDYSSLCALSETSTQLHALATDEHLWQHLAARRFRASRVPRGNMSRTTRTTPSWRTLFAAWHAQGRMPHSRQTGMRFRSFVRAERPWHVRLWLCVTSADDCRLRDGALRARVVVQNVGGGGGTVRVMARRVGFVLCDGGVVRAGERADAHAGVGAQQTAFAQVATVWRERERERGDGGENEEEEEGCELRLDEFAVVSVVIGMHDATFEVEVLERLRQVFVPLSAGGEARATMVERRVWDAYEQLPGGWWVRRA